MNRICVIIAIGMLLGVFVPTLTQGQPNVRDEDHFWRKRVVNRIPLGEKINTPLIRHMSEYYATDNRYTETDGMVVSLVNGLKQGKYLAYHPEDWQNRMTYQDLSRRMEEFNQALIGESVSWEEEEETDEFERAEEDEWEWDLAEGEDADEWGSPFEEEPEFVSENIPMEQDFAAYEEVIHMVEDWIFDRNTSSMVQKIDFFEIVWVDPTGSLPEKVLARFKWEDVKEQLDVTMWKTRHNDAEAKSIKEVFELRIFHGFFINVGGEPIRSLAEAERRRQELIEFESYLWSY